MDIECADHQTNAPANVGTSQKQKAQILLLET
jgi:hypothetical protein